MFPMEKAVWDLLKNNIKFDDKLVIPLIRRLTPEDETPCITIQQAAESQLQRKILPGKTEVIRLKNNSEVWINIWCDTEEQRNSLIQQTELRIFQALGNHYTTCINYSNEQCKSLNRTCECLTVDNGRSSKNQCPYPNRNGYENWFKSHNIIKNSFRISGRHDMDELDISKPVLRTIIQLDMDYYIYHDLGGKLFDGFTVSEELL